MAGIDPLFLVSFSVLLATIILIIAFLIKRNWDENKAHARAQEFVAMEQQRRGRARPRQNAADADGEAAGSDDEDLAADPGMGKKKMAKLQAKAERRAQREYEERERAERKEQEAQRQAEEEERRKAENDAQKAAEQKAQKDQERRETREEKEYAKLKKHFEIIEEGFDQLDEEEFIEYVKKSKIVYLDELGERFHLRSKMATDKLKDFLADGTLSGVIDERGRFVYITEEEMLAVANFFNQQGRVSLSEFADFSNELIALEPLA